MKQTHEVGSTISAPHTQNLWKRLMVLCNILCWSTAGLVLCQLVAKCLNYTIPGWLAGMTTILLAALVGYGTNALAIAMLFKPYVKTRKHYISLLTLGLWQQGLVPAKKDEIAVELGEQIENRLLDPEQIANEFCQAVSDLIDNDHFLTQAESVLRGMLTQHEDTIVEHFYPLVTQTLYKALDDFTTPEQTSKFVGEVIVPLLQRDSTRQYIVDALTKFGRQRTSTITDMIRNEARTHIRNYLKKNPLTTFFADTITDPLVNSFPWQNIEWKIYDKLNSSEFQNILKEELLRFVEDFRSQLKTKEMQSRIGEFASAINNKLKTWLKDYLQKVLSSAVSSVIHSESLWSWIRESLLPSAKPAVEEWIRAHGKNLVIEKLRISQRVRQAVDRQDIKEFHDMVNSLAAQHLGAIQVLGYILGAIAGVVQLLVSR